MSDRLASLAERVRDDALFLASALDDYARGERLDRPGLAAALGVDVDTLPAIELCRRPRPETFRQDLEQVAHRFQARVDALAEAVRRSDALEALRMAEDDTGALMAARDRDEGGDGPP